MADRSLLGQCDRERDQEERHADAVVEAGLHVQALTDTDGEALGRHDDLTQRRVGRREDDRDEERLGPGEVGQQDERGGESGEDRERQPDPEQSRGDVQRSAQGREVDPRRVREEDDREGRLREGLDLEAFGLRIDEPGGRCPRRGRRP